MFSDYYVFRLLYFQIIMFSDCLLCFQIIMFSDYYVLRLSVMFCESQVYWIWRRSPQSKTTASMALRSTQRSSIFWRLAPSIPPTLDVDGTEEGAQSAGQQRTSSFKTIGSITSREADDAWSSRAGRRGIDSSLSATKTLQRAAILAPRWQRRRQWLFTSGIIWG